MALLELQAALGAAFSEERNAFSEEDGDDRDGQIVDAIRNGKRPDGTTIGPPMPIEYYRNLSDSDVRAIVAYLRTVKPIKNKTEKSTYMTKVGAGGREFEVHGGGLITSTNLTPANDAGIARWSDAQVKNAIAQGARPDRALVPLMAFEWYKNISADHLDAVVAYLRTLKPAMP